MKKRNLQSLCMAVFITISAVVPSYGAVGPGPAVTPIPDGMTEEQWIRLNDQTIEFNELPDLVMYFNPSMQNTIDTIQDSIGNVQYIYDEMRRYISDLDDSADGLRDSGAVNTVEGMQQYIIINMTEKGIKTLQIPWEGLWST